MENDLMCFAAFLICFVFLVQSAAAVSSLGRVPVAVPDKYHGVAMLPHAFSHSEGKNTVIYPKAHYNYNVTEWEEHAPATIQLTRVDNDSRPANNMCQHGKLVPELYVAGVVKAATTSFSNDLRESPAIIWPYKPFWDTTRDNFESDFVRGNTVKEGHFFDDYYFMGKGFMLDSYPLCRKDMRVTAIESSPRYFMDPRVPSRIALWYGDQLKYRIKFVVLLRNSLHRMHSDFWHGKESDWCVDYRNNSFSDWVDIVLSGGWRKFVGGTPGCNDRLEGSMYKPAMERWFSNFSPQQFYIVPWYYQIHPTEHTVAETIWSELEIQRGKRLDDSHFNDRTHPDLDEDLSKEKQLEFLKFIANQSSAETLAHVFTSMPGAHLHGYKGRLDDEPTIAEWLENNW